MARPRSRRARAPAIDVDAIDEVIVWQLVRDARTTLTDLAALAGVAASTCHGRLRSLQERGVVQSFHARTNLESLGLPLQAIIAVSLRPRARSQLRDFAEHIVRQAQVLNVFFIGGPDDFLVHVACSSSSHLRDFVEVHLSAQPAVATTHTSIVFDHLVGAQHMDHLAGLEQMRSRIE